MEYKLIGLYDLDSRMANIPLMKIASFYKEYCERYIPLKHDQYAQIYCSSIFDFSDKSYITDDMICGGSGFDLTTNLPKEFERCDPDYSIYPNCNYSIGFTSRGCIRNCPFCIVPQKEGKIKSVADIYDIHRNRKAKWIEILDNNFFAQDWHEWQDRIYEIEQIGLPVNFNQGLDIRILDKEQAIALSEITHIKQIHFAFDDIAYEKSVIKGIELLNSVGIASSRLMFYVLIGFNSTQEEDLYRVELLRKLGVDPFVMPYMKNKYTQKFARWVNHKATFNSCSFREYKG